MDQHLTLASGDARAEHVAGLTEAPIGVPPRVRPKPEQGVLSLPEYRKAVHVWRAEQQIVASRRGATGPITRDEWNDAVRAVGPVL